MTTSNRCEPFTLSYFVKSRAPIHIIKYFPAFNGACVVIRKELRYYSLHPNLHGCCVELRCVERERSNMGKQIKLKYNFVKMTRAAELKYVRSTKKENRSMIATVNMHRAHSSYIFMKLSSTVRPNNLLNEVKFNQNPYFRWRSSTFDDGSRACRRRGRETKCAIDSLPRSFFSSSFFAFDKNRFASSRKSIPMKWFSESRFTLYLLGFILLAQWKWKK